MVTRRAWPLGVVTASIEEPRGARENQVSCGCDGILPLRRRFPARKALSVDREMRWR